MAGEQASGEPVSGSTWLESRSSFHLHDGHRPNSPDHGYLSTLSSQVIWNTSTENLQVFLLDNGMNAGLVVSGMVSFQ